MDLKKISEKERTATDFANVMTTIINAIYEINKKDNYILEVKDRYAIVRRENPFIIITIVGPYLWKYRENIKTGNLDVLLNNDFRDDVFEARGLIPDCFDKIEDIINSFKRSWILFNTNEKEILKKKLQKMLAYYSGYLSVCKNSLEN